MSKHTQHNSLRTTKGTVKKGFMGWGTDREGAIPPAPMGQSKSTQPVTFWTISREGQRVRYTVLRDHK